MLMTEIWSACQEGSTVCASHTGCTVLFFSEATHTAPRDPVCCEPAPSSLVTVCWPIQGLPAAHEWVWVHEACSLLGTKSKTHCWIQGQGRSLKTDMSIYQTKATSSKTVPVAKCIHLKNCHSSWGTRGTSNLRALGDFLSMSRIQEQRNGD